MLKAKDYREKAREALNARIAVDKITKLNI